MQNSVEMLLPIAIGDYTDFFSSLHHTKNCGIIFRGPQNPVLENWCVHLEVLKDLEWISFFKKCVDFSINL